MPAPKKAAPQPQQPSNKGGMTFLQPTTPPPAPPPQKTLQQTTSMHNDLDEKLDTIIKHLKRMDRRDAMRTWGGFFRTILWIVIVVGGAWFTYQYGDDIVSSIAQRAAESAAQSVQEQSSSILENINLSF